MNGVSRPAPTTATCKGPADQSFRDGQPVAGETGRTRGQQACTRDGVRGRRAVPRQDALTSNDAVSSAEASEDAPDGEALSVESAGRRTNDSASSAVS